MPQEGLHPWGRAQGFSGEQAWAQSLPTRYHPGPTPGLHSLPPHPPTPAPTPETQGQAQSASAEGTSDLPGLGYCPPLSLPQQTPPQEVCLPSRSP